MITAEPSQWKAPFLLIAIIMYAVHCMHTGA